MNCFINPLYHIVRVFLCWLLLCCASAVAAVKPTVAAPHKFAVVLPKTSRKAQVVYDEIERGLRSVDDVELVLYRLKGNKLKAAVVHKWLREQRDIDAIITVGSIAYRLTKDYTTKIPLIAGGVSISPNRASGVSLNGDPGEFFENLKRIAPQVDRVFLVYNEIINGWWVDRARAKAAEHKIDFVAPAAKDLTTGARLYQNILELARPEKDAIWIPLNGIVPAKTVMPQVLKTAWDKSLVVFTNSAAHARRGALFSLYPDNLAMGKQLAELAVEKVIAGNFDVRVEPVKKLKTAINARTASHLGLNYPLKRGNGFDRIYSAR